MKKKHTLIPLLVLVISMVFYSCERYPQVFSINNFRTGFEENGKSDLVKRMPVKGLTGVWFGLEHKLTISHSISSGYRNDDNKLLKDTCFFVVELIDTLNKESIFGDTTLYDLVFFSIEGQQYIEVVSPGTKIAAHDFMLPISTYLKLNKLTKDTIIIQMPEGKYTEAFLKTNDYKYFIPYENLSDEISPIYLIENPEKMAQLLKALYPLKEAFQRADTLVRLR